MEQIESGHIVIFTVDLAVDQPDYHLAGCADDRAVEAVSYTHLDVYKRQQLLSAEGSLADRAVDDVGLVETVLDLTSLGLLNSLGTVSYTHLDVYKRQVLFTALPVTVIVLFLTFRLPAQTCTPIVLAVMVESSIVTAPELGK